LSLLGFFILFQPDLDKIGFKEVLVGRTLPGKVAVSDVWIYLRYNRLYLRGGATIHVKVPERLSEKFRERGLILRVGGATVGMSPPLCITPSEVDEIVSALDSSIGELEIELATSG